MVLIEMVFSEWLLQGEGAPQAEEGMRVNIARFPFAFRFDWKKRVVQGQM
jgi:hypothetical protein